MSRAAVGGKVNGPTLGTGRTGYRFTAEDLAFLTSAAGTDALRSGDGLALRDDTLLADLTRLRHSAGSHAAAVAETVSLRRRAIPKLGPAAAAWLLTDESLQQATPRPVAEHRAARLAGIGVHDLTCSIGADLAALSATPAETSSETCAVGSDLDELRVMMARHNLRSAGLDARVFVADALTRTSRGRLGYADPARRDGAGRRIMSVDTMPSIGDLDRVHAGRPPVLRVPPGLDYIALARPGEVELVSLDGTVREAVLWPTELAGPERRASVLRSAGAAEFVSSADPDDCGVTPAGDLIVEPDGAVIRAGLVRHWAARHGLAQLDSHLAYVTGARTPPGYRGFRIREQAGYSERVVAGWIRRDRIGTLEIKQRGTGLVPDDLRRRLRSVLTKDTRAAATLVVARIGRDEIAFWCTAESSPPG